MFGKKWTESGPGVMPAARDSAPDARPPPRPQQRISLDMRGAMAKPGRAVASPAPAALALNPGPRRLIVGREITLRGEIGACDDLVVEGFVAASAADCRAITITQTGAFEGKAEFETAEIEGAFDGDLTVRDRLTVRGTGRVSGRVRYGRIEVEPGGQVSGDICRIDSDDDAASLN